VLKPDGRFVVSTPHQPNSLFRNENPEFDEHLREYLPAELEHVLKGCFGEVEVKGVFGDRDSDDIERRRAWRRPENYYFPGRYLKPVRSLFRLFRKLFLRGRKFGQDELRKLNSPKQDRELTKHFHVGTDNMHLAHHLIAFCRKTEPVPLPAGVQFHLSSQWTTRRDRIAAKWLKTLSAQGTIDSDQATRLHDPWPALDDEEVVAALRGHGEGLLVVADGPTERRRPGGLRARSINHWAQLLSAAEFELVASRPIEGFCDALHAETGPMRRLLDRLLLPLFPWRASCCLLLARRRRDAAEAKKGSQFVSGESQHERTHNERAIAELTRDSHQTGS
jgi:hypothetical protein